MDRLAALEPDAMNTLVSSILLIVYTTMAPNLSKADDLPWFDGNPAKYRDYRHKVIWLVSAVPDDKQHLVAPALVPVLQQEMS